MQDNAWKHEQRVFDKRWVTESKKQYTYAFLLLSPVLYDYLVTSQCMQFTFGDNREVYLLDMSALPVAEKEGMHEGKEEQALG